MKVLTVIGARPQFIKAAPVSRALAKDAELQEVIVHTGQHYDPNMSDVFFRELEMRPPDYDLGIGSGSHGDQTGRMLIAIEPVMVDERPDAVIVFGDTNSTLAAALVAAKLHIPIAHIEAGLRSFNTRMPEELNRVIADHLSTLLLAPTRAAEENLAREGISNGRVQLVGDVMYDAVLLYGEKSERTSKVLERERCIRGDYVLATIHRPDNVDSADHLRTIFDALAEVATRERVIVPLHPRTRASLARNSLGTNLPEGLSLIDPVGYLDMIMLEKNARVIVTDSGGVQKEAFFFRVPCVTLRTETEWVELLTAGWNVLVPPLEAGPIVTAIRGARVPRAFDSEDIYGNGHAADAIATLISALVRRSVG